MDVKKHQKSELVNLLPPVLRDNINKYVEMENLYEAAIKGICTRLEILDNEFETRYDRNPIHHIENRIKTPESIFRKLKKYGYDLSLESAMQNINDIAGVRVICSYQSDVYQVSHMLCKHDDIKVLDIRDYINKPKKTGYRSLHLILEVPVYTIESKELVPIEVQLRTIGMDYFASIEHQLKYKTKNKMNEELNQELTKCAEIISQTDVMLEEIYKKLVNKV